MEFPQILKSRLKECKGEGKDSRRMAFISGQKEFRGFIYLEGGKWQASDSL